LLFPPAVEAFSLALGRDLAVEGGGARVYLPGAGRDDAPFRHFLLPATVIARSRDVAGRIIADRLAISMAARRAPEEYEIVRRALSGAGTPRSVEELEVLWDEAVEEADRLRRAAEVAEDERVSAILEFDEAERDNEHLRARLAFMSQQLAGATALTDEQAGIDLPASADDPSDAVRLAREHLSEVVVPQTAEATTAELDGALQANVWGQKTWQALRALHLYALDHESFGGFWDWCERSGHPYAWPATPKKLAMSESETALTEFREDRVFAIDPRVHGEETQLMTAHIKVSNGGGQLSPRIYFYDNTKGVTGKVHVGFVGPHRYLRNASSN
jgi:hypothetical protein